MDYFSILCLAHLGGSKLPFPVPSQNWLYASIRNWWSLFEQQGRVTQGVLADFSGLSTFLIMKKFGKSTTSFSQAMLKVGASFKKQS